MKRQNYTEMTAKHDKWREVNKIKNETM